VAAVPSGFDTKPSGFIGGGQIGYNYQMGWFVWGVEADFSGTDIKGSNSKTLTAAVVDTVTSTTIVNTISGTGNQKLNWLGTGRARVGVVPFTPLLVYATGGVAYGNVSSEVSFTQSYNFNCFCGPNPTTGASISTTQWGWTAGGGVEWLFAPHWSVRAEFLYYNLGHVSVNTTLTQLNGAGVPFTTVGITSTADAKGDIVRGGINYKF
jgi:outer membrane immunogenic protein